MKRSFNERNLYEIERPGDVLSANLLKVSVASWKLGLVPEAFWPGACVRC